MSDFLVKVTENLDDFTPSHKFVAQYIIYHLDTVAFKPLATVAENIGVSTTTIVRFAKRLGYNGYSDFQKEIQGIILNKGISPENQDIDSLNPSLVESFNTDIENLKYTLESQKFDDIDQAVDRIYGAKRLYILGLRTSYTLAYYSYIRFAQIREKVTLINANGLSYPEELLGISEADAVVVFAFPRLVSVTSKIIEWLVKNKIPIVLVTSMNFLAAGMSNTITLPCRVVGSSYQNSAVAPLALINFLSYALAAKHESQGIETLKKLEDIMADDFYSL